MFYSELRVLYELFVDSNFSIILEIFEMYVFQKYAIWLQFTISVKVEVKTAKDTETPCSKESIFIPSHRFFSHYLATIKQHPTFLGFRSTRQTMHVFYCKTVVNVTQQKMLSGTSSILHPV